MIKVFSSAALPIIVEPIYVAFGCEKYKKLHKRDAKRAAEKGDGRETLSRAT